MEWGKLFAGVLFVFLAVALGVQYSEQLHGRITEVENWIAGLGAWGPVAYLILVIVLTSLFFPDSVLSAVAGVLFGPWLGTTLMFVAAIIVQSIAYHLSHHFFQRRVQRTIERQPKLANIQRAANSKGLRLQLLLRLLPLNPVLVSYILGTTSTRFSVFIAACMGLVPGLFVQVYTGFAAKHMIKAAAQPGEHSTMHTMLVAGGLVACLLLLVVMVRAVHKRVAEIVE